VSGLDVFDIPGCWEAMVSACPNLGRPGVVSADIAAVDIALWGLKARDLELSLPALVGPARHQLPYMAVAASPISPPISRHYPHDSRRHADVESTERTASFGGDR
jgi:L-alanine-DL-glutamate epimerase-like enolase superfamily enzyme